MLSEKNLDDLFFKICETLRESPFASPADLEIEPKFVAREIIPRLKDVLKPISILRIEGEGVRRARASRLFGCSFYPDISVMQGSDRLIAFEAKYIPREPASAQGNIASAIGQAEIYRLNGYRRSGIILISDRRISSTELEQTRILCRLDNRCVIYRRITQNGLQPDRSIAFDVL